jgi:hypothetical protein
MKYCFVGAEHVRTLFARLSLVVFVGLASQQMFAQPYLQVRPISFGDIESQRKFNLNVDIRGLVPATRIDTRFMLPVDNDALQRSEEKEALRGPFRFGHSLKVRLGTDNAGTWETLPNGDRIWRLRIVSPGAHSLNFLYDKFLLPEGALFFIYNDVQVDKNKDNLIGAFSSEHSSLGAYSTDLLKGSTAILEYYEPRSMRGKGVIRLSSVIHGYRNAFAYLKELSTTASKSNSQGELAAVSCHLDINSAAGANYQTVKRGVAVVLAGNGTSICSGSLVNNTGTSYRPYFLTALHCVDGGDGVLNSSEIQSLQSWLFKFNYESGGMQPITYGGGCNVRAGVSGSDGLLVELNQRVSSSLYMNGWSASSVTPSTPLASIHHPTGDLKKISISNSAPTSTVYQPSPYYPAQSWGVSWDFSNGVNTGGKSEFGSSGGPLFNSQMRIVGQCYGGNSSSIPCGLPQVVYFGKFDIGWLAFQTWLSPSGGVTDYNGISPMNVTISGPSKLTPGNTAILTATVSGGAPPYSSVDWYVTYPPSTIEYYLASGSSLTIYGNTDEQQFIARVHDAATPQSKIEQGAKTVVNGFGTLAVIPSTEIPVEVAVSPNPFAESSIISYILPDDATVSVEICNALQQPVQVLAKNVRQQAGYYEFTPQASIPNGAYFVRLIAQNAAGKVYRTSSSILITK